MKQISHFHISFTLFFLIFFPLIASCQLLSPKAFALNMSNANYIIQMGNIDTAAGKPTNSNYSLGITVGQIGAGLYSGSNYKVRSGFQYVPLTKFAFSISTPLQVDFGQVTPQNPITRTQTLTISNGSAFGYQVTVSENHQLMIPSSGQLIPDTACDGPSCTTTTAQPWTSITTYGFGYNCTNLSGTDCPSDFTNSTYYRPFVASPSAVVIMSNSNVAKNHKVTVTYKLNIAPIQAAGLYTNIINYIATPTF